MGVMLKGQPQNPFHPGEILLEECLLPGGVTQTAFVQRLGWTRARLNVRIKGKRELTADAALDLTDALGTSARFCLYPSAAIPTPAAVHGSP
jgi:hypothetical protein